MNEQQQQTAETPTGAASVLDDGLGVEDEDMSELTTGPWKAKRLATYQEPGWVVLWPDKGGTHMRRLDSNGNFTGPDAALIAAAPELLAAAKKVNALSIQTEAHKELRAAIAKATEHDA